MMAQIDGVSVTKIEITPRKTCQPDGKITLTVKNLNKRPLLYQLQTQAGQLITQRSDAAEFDRLSPNNYRVKVLNRNNHGIEYFTQDVEVKNEYRPISTAQISIEGLCGSFTPGATIKVNPSTIVGGTAPFRYWFVKADGPNFADDDTKYQTSPEFKATEFGIYQVRIKDACGYYTTIRQDVKPTLAVVKIQAEVLNNQPCGSGMAQLGAVGLIDPVTNRRVSFDQYIALGGVKVELREKDQNGELLMESIIKGDNGTSNTDPTNQAFIFKVAKSHKYWAKITTPCGESYEGSQYLKTEPSFWLRPIVAGCPGDGAGHGMKIKCFDFVFATYPTTVIIKKRSTGEEMERIRLSGPSDALFSSKILPFDTYTVSAINDCGFIIADQNVGDPSTQPINTLSQGYSLAFCDRGAKYTRVEGTTGVYFGLTGYVRDQENVRVRIKSGPSNVGVEGNYRAPDFRFYNMVPGDYIIEVISRCETKTLPLKVAPEERYILRQSLTSTASSKCVGGGSITSVVNSNTGLPTTVELLDENWNNVKSNGKNMESSSGTFSNLPPGTYYTRLRVRPWCGPIYYVNNPTPLVITTGVAGPRITSSTGVACEDISGKVGQKGAIYLHLSAGDSPTLQYRKKGTSTWTTLSYKSYVEIEGLDVATYEVRLESCGKSVNEEVEVKKLTPSMRMVQNHPCLHQPYTISVPFYSGARYAWVKDGQVLGNSHKFDFSSFEESDNGVYICKLQWGNCVTREVRYILNANLCGTEIGDITLAGSVFNDKNGLTNGVIDGTPIQQVSKRPLYIHVMMKLSGTLFHLGTRTPVDADGTFSIAGLAPNIDYRLILTTKEQTQVQSSPIAGWSFVGESTSNSGSDGTPDGVLIVPASNKNQLDLRFGVKQRFALRSNRHITTKL